MMFQVILCVIRNGIIESQVKLFIVNGIKVWSMSENSISRQNFPEFVLPDLNGRKVKITDYSRKRLIIFMWASW